MCGLLNLNILERAPASADMTPKNKIDRYINRLKKKGPVLINRWIIIRILSVLRSEASSICNW